MEAVEPSSAAVTSRLLDLGKYFKVSLRVQGGVWPTKQASSQQQSESKQLSLGLNHVFIKLKESLSSAVYSKPAVLYILLKIGYIYIVFIYTLLYFLIFV